MGQLSLVNRSGKTIITGDYVKFYPNSRDSFVFADIGDANIIGQAAQTVSSGARCLINLLNTVDYSSLEGLPATFPPAEHTHTFEDIEETDNDPYQPLNANLTRLATYRRIGGDVHHVEFEEDGTLKMVGDATVWNDSMIPAVSFRTGGTALTFIDCGNGIFLTRFDVGDIFYVQVQLPHDMKVNTTIHPHLHLMVNTAIGATGYNVEVTTSQAWANIGEVFPVPSVVSTGLVVSFQNAAQYTHKLLTLTPISPSAAQGGISSYVMYKVERITASIQPISPAATIFILGMDIHYECDTLGSRSELSK
jgi:hypothetical protein